MHAQSCMIGSRVLSKVMFWLSRGLRYLRCLLQTLLRDESFKRHLMTSFFVVALAFLGLG
jgi:hypothetical protein